MSALHLADSDTRADLATYLARARSLDADGAVRLQATGRALAVWVGVLRGRGLMNDGTVVGLRVLPLAQPADVDTVVPLSAVTDRLARLDGSDGLEVDVPPMTVRTTWAAMTPPRAGWAPVGDVEVATLKKVAAEGISEVAQGAPEGSGAAAVDALRQRVWGRAIPLVGGADGLPAGVAFAGHVLGFHQGEDAQVFTAARWYRVSTSAGHVLVR